jgi:diguanylate cyclase (GGDEF)-like protein/PAS domain S-box-containing protein
MSQAARFILIAVLFAPFVSGIFILALRPPAPGHSIWAAFLHWYMADALGIAITTPVVMAAYRGSIPKIWNPTKALESLGISILLTVGGCISLFQPDLAVVGLFFPLVILGVVRMGWITGALATLAYSIVASIVTAAGIGPFAALADATVAGRFFEMQLFLAALTASAAIVATVYEERLRMLQLAREKERSIRLLTESSPDVMLLNDLSNRILYSTNAVRRMLGYQPVELTRRNFQHDLLHPDEIPAYNDALDAVRRQNESRILIYRMRRKDGSWMWAEGAISLYRDEIAGDPIGFVNVVRDITHRKEAEDRLQSAYNELEILAAIDSLTGVANRRHFDAVLDSEWKRAIRSGTCVAMLLIDVDFFKNFNDIYGHVMGDDCLRDIAATASQCVRSVTDLVARFGGEEFAIVLPETDESGAAALAERIRSAVESHGIRHAGNSHGVITVSVGCAAMTPRRGSSSIPLIEAADKALYHAKNMGRNAVVRASYMEQHIDSETTQTA